MLSAIIIELKWNQSATGAIAQINNKNYPQILKEYTDDILLVGISYDKKNKEHTCLIEKYMN
ncbi:MAG: hypothetical protein II919_03210 [Lachnospiraceae bacterium]|nr:hypothetical protein [Lachnospiraceae bacterium]